MQIEVRGDRREVDLGVPAAAVPIIVKEPVAWVIDDVLRMCRSIRADREMRGGERMPDSAYPVEIGSRQHDLVAL